MRSRSRSQSRKEHHYKKEKEKEKAPFLLFHLLVCYAPGVLGILYDLIDSNESLKKEGQPVPGSQR